MITETELTQLVQATFPDADVAVMDITGMMDHFRLYIASKAFEGKNPIQRHKMVYKALDEAMQDGRIHALEIKTDVPQ
jgi:stress-induced morphogen